MIQKVSGLVRCWSICTLIYFILFLSINLDLLIFFRARYLTFDDPNNINLDECKILVLISLIFFCWLVVTNGTPCLDVLNTECHPFKAAPASCDTVYGSGSTVNQFLPFSPVEGELPAVSALPSLPGLVFGPQGILAKLSVGIIGWLRSRPEIPEYAYFVAVCEGTNQAVIYLFDTRNLTLCEYSSVNKNWPCMYLLFFLMAQ